MINPNTSPEKQAAAMLWQDYQRSYQAQFNELYLEGNESEVMSVYDHPDVQKDVSVPDLRVKTVQSQLEKRLILRMRETGVMKEWKALPL